ncbi:MAG: hypothetical protein A3H01_00855 [Candidatus Wildermuthbacteria bacterium RIFCSPLOWO2_12_FULL_40_9]|uniref:SCP domain-containing protein n=2 Tax=Candidatus Wildermuthiibacteriota TaxID=1817923 RepID=A0A1G2RDL0_9BACT|nr:MAG: hypothetical protein A3F15_02075 [Candidatus Wildermuthbacteria bacterium RIFCSPHIGHO2_12_FULL_40_12]OHA76811.1 MAG: hypothetical protein A3H01_00855 [Candidatus Wildermuthbacteria bacterium RIFCSPLOWO2_12_FULL_40_9]
MKILRIIIIVLLFAALLVLGFRLWQDIVKLSSRLDFGFPEKEEELGKQISSPPPLRAKRETPESFLTKEGVLIWTNAQRQRNNMVLLKENHTLNLMAQAKVKDMFDNQYFAHESLSGKGAGDLAADFSYQFLAVGENLALGNFKDDEALVEAWMASEGHRKNILSGVYQEIGVAVGKGVFEGKTTWLAVQHFGLPSSVCPGIDTTLQANVEEKEAQVSALAEQLSVMEAEIKAMKGKRNQREEYEQKAEEYNQLVVQYNALVEENKALVSTYNVQVNSFNSCVAGYLGE